MDKCAAIHGEGKSVWWREIIITQPKGRKIIILLSIHSIINLLFIYSPMYWFFHLSIHSFISVFIRSSTFLFIQWLLLLYLFKNKVLCYYLTLNLCVRVCVCVCEGVCVWVCVWACHRYCDEMAGLSNMASIDVNTLCNDATLINIFLLLQSSTSVSTLNEMMPHIII